MSKEIAQTILAQLGGKMFALMTGANSFTFDGPSLTFRIPRTPKGGFRAVKITLNGNDLYDLTFYKIHGTKVTEESTNDVYVDSLRFTFTENTGLYTSFGRTS